MPAPLTDPARWRGAARALAAFLRARLRRSGRYGLAFTLALAATAAALAGFLALVDALFDERVLDPLDAAAQALVEGHRTPGRTYAALALARFGGSVVTAVLVAAVGAGLAVYRRRWLLFRLLVATGVGALVMLALKWLFGRERPLAPVVESAGYSFPSGHAFTATVFYGMGVYLVWASTRRALPRALALALGTAMALAIGLSRVYLNVHYATDVAGGWLAGLVWLLGSVLAVDAVEGWARGRRSPRPEGAGEPGAPHEERPGAHHG